MILFVRAVNGEIDYIRVEQFGMFYQTWPLESFGEYQTMFGTFTLTVSEDDAIAATLEGQQPAEWSKANDLYRFVFLNLGVEPEPEGGAVNVYVEDGISIGERLA